MFNTGTVWLFAIPIVFLWYAFRMTLGRPPYDKGRDSALPLRRVRESEEIWNYSQRFCGILCLVLAIVMAISAYVLLIVLSESRTAYWAQLIFEVVCAVGFVPAVNAAVDKKFPAKKRRK